MSFSEFNLLLNLVPTLRELLVNWLQLHDVAKLDSALCTSQHRRIFLKILDEKSCVFDHLSKDLHGKHLKWVSLRNAKISSAEMTNYFPSADWVQLFHATGLHLRELIASSIGSSGIAFKISTMCINLEMLIFSDNDLRKNNICSVLQYLPRLQHLDLSRCKNVSDAMLANICDRAKTLRVLDLSHCQMDEGALRLEAVQANYSIRTLSITDCNQIRIFLPFIHQCKALTSLYVSYITLDDVFLMLRQCPALATLSAGVDATDIYMYVAYSKLGRAAFVSHRRLPLARAAIRKSYSTVS